MLTFWTDASRIAYFVGDLPCFASLRETGRDARAKILPRRAAVVWLLFFKQKRCDWISKKHGTVRYDSTARKIHNSSQRGTTMRSDVVVTHFPARPSFAGNMRIDLLPEDLKAQCRALIRSYHDIHGYACLPDMLWRTGLGHFIEMNKEFNQLLRKASTTRSAKKSNEGFVTIATAILSWEILASEFSGWGKMYPESRQAANRILGRRASGSYTLLMEQYLYPRQSIDPAIVAAFMPRRANHTEPTGSYRPSISRVIGEAASLGHANALHETC